MTAAGVARICVDPSVCSVTAAEASTGSRAVAPRG